MLVLAVNGTTDDLEFLSAVIVIEAQKPLPLHFEMSSPIVCRNKCAPV
jgi:hypothetical protein